MTATYPAGRKALATYFLRAARRYWLSVFPCIRRETRHWRERAEAIPDPVLRRLALEAQRIKRGNIEGSAAFAAFAPAAHRDEVVRAQVAFQSAYDYADTLSEQPSGDPVVNGRQLHQALLAARVAGVVVGLAAHRLANRIVSYQSLNLSEPHGGHCLLKRWALRETPLGTGLRWWETAASAGSSLGLFALIAAAARPALQPSQAIAIERAYWPWVGALHSLLDSLIDEPEDAAVAQRSLLDYYTSPQEAAARVQLLAREALRTVRSLPNAHEHVLILAGMASFYLTAPEASSPTARLVSEKVIETLGPVIRPSMAVFGARRTASRIPRRHHTGERISSQGAQSAYARLLHSGSNVPSFHLDAIPSRQERGH
jgi:tetraprenyl-beta-curcumene synthase